MNLWLTVRLLAFVAGVSVVGGEFTIGELIIDNLLRYNCSIQFDYEFDLIPKNASGLRLAFSSNHVIDFHQWKIPALPQLDVLEIDVSYVPQPLPETLFSNLKRLDKLNIYHHLQTTPHFRVEPNSMSFRGFYRLTALNLPSLGLKSLPDEILNGLTKLKSMDLNQNQLTTLPPDVFNSCCMDLIWLNLAKNRFLEVPSVSLRNLPSLRQLSFYGNGITRLSTGDFSTLKNLTELNFDSNRLELIEHGAFRGLSRLRKLFADGNLLESISGDMFDGLAALEQLDLSQNRIGELRSATFESLESLKELSLNRNRIRFIEPGAFEGLTQLVRLELAENPITSLESGSLAGLANLRDLRMEAGSLFHLANDSFGPTPLLSELYLAKNSLTFLPDEIFATSKSLQVVDISYNPWNCDCKLISIFRDLNNRTEIRFENRLMTSCASPENVENASIFDLKMAATGNDNDSCVAIMQSSGGTTRFILTTVLLSSEATSTYQEATTFLDLDEGLRYERSVVIILICGLTMLLTLICGFICILRRFRHSFKWKLWKH